MIEIKISYKDVILHSWENLQAQHQNLSFLSISPYMCVCVCVRARVRVCVGVFLPSRRKREPCKQMQWSVSVSTVLPPTPPTGKEQAGPNLWKVKSHGRADGREQHILEGDVFFLP